MTMMQSVRTVLFEKYATFRGRAERPEYWWYTLFTLLVGVVFSVLEIVTGAFVFIGLLDSVFSLVTLIPTLAVGARRLHDVNRSGWWQTAPIVGWVAVGASWEAGNDFLFYGAMTLAVITSIVLIYWLASRGTEGPNHYGDPASGGTDPEIFA